MPSAGGGAVGALDYPDSERKELARCSLSWTCSKCGSCNATALPDISACSEPSPVLVVNEKTDNTASSPTPRGEPAQSQPKHPAGDYHAERNENQPVSAPMLQNTQQLLQPPAENNSPSWLNWLIVVLLAAIVTLLLRKTW